MLDRLRVSVAKGLLTIEDMDLVEVMNIQILGYLLRNLCLIKSSDLSSESWRNLARDRSWNIAKSARWYSRRNGSRDTALRALCLVDEGSPEKGGIKLVNG